MTDVPPRISRTYPDLAGKKVCKTCDFCVKPNMWQSSGWECKAPQNATSLLNTVSGDWIYQRDLCYEVKPACNAGDWYQQDPYIPVNGVRLVDSHRTLSTPSSRVSIKNLTLDDIL